jgi:hypothetical protein
MPTPEQKIEKEEKKVAVKKLYEEGKVLLGCSGWKTGFYIMMVLAFIATIIIITMYFMNKT